MSCHIGFPSPFGSNGLVPSLSKVRISPISVSKGERLSYDSCKAVCIVRVDSGADHTAGETSSNYVTKDSDVIHTYIIVEGTKCKVPEVRY